MARIRTGSRVYYTGDSAKYKHMFGVVVSSKYDPFLRIFSYVVRLEADSGIARFFEHELDAHNNYYEDCDCGGVYLDIEHHYDWCKIYEYHYRKKEEEDIW